MGAKDGGREERYEREGFVTAGDGTRIFFEESGPEEAEEAVLLCDGIGCDGFAWKYLAPALGERYRVVHWHYRGHGRSGLPADPARIDVLAHAQDLVAVMDGRGVRRGVLVGHSMGTQVSLEGYRLAPERVAGLILCCGSYGRVTETFRGSDMLKQVLPTIVEVVEQNLGLVRALWGRVPSGLAFQLARLSRDLDALSVREEDFAPYMEHLASLDPSLFLRMLRAAGEHTAEDLLASVRAPTLVIAAENDTFTPAVLAQHMAEAIPEAELFELRGASHAAPIEQPMAIELRVYKFLGERVGLGAQGSREGDER